jgi:hypothetical protein
VEELRAVPLERWPALRLETHPAIRILDTDWPLDMMIGLLNTRGALDTPIQQQRIAIIVWCQHYEVYVRRFGVKSGQHSGLLCEAPLWTKCAGRSQVA